MGAVGQDEEPPPDSQDRVSNSETQSSGVGKSERFTTRFLVAATVALIWTIVLSGFVAAKTDVARAVAAFFASLVGVVTGIVGVFEPPGFPTIDPKVTRGVIVVILIVDFGLSVGWGGWSYYQANRAVDVFSQVSLTNNIGVFPGRRAALDVNITVKRSRIELVFQATDTRSDAGSCVPNTEFLVTPDAAGNRGVTVVASPGTPVWLDLPDGTKHLHLDIAVTNTRDDQNCAVNLSVTRATLQNA
jgi:hypothetical protein